MLTIHIIRKPLSEKNVASNVLRWGTGALNIDSCRVATKGEGSPSIKRRETAARTGCTMRLQRNLFCKITETMAQNFSTPRPGEELGRWPANVILSEGEAVEDLDEQSGESTSAQLGKASAGASRYFKRVKEQG